MAHASPDPERRTLGQQLAEITAMAGHFRFYLCLLADMFNERADGVIEYETRA